MVTSQKQASRKPTLGTSGVGGTGFLEPSGARAPTPKPGRYH